MKSILGDKPIKLTVCKVDIKAKGGYFAEPKTEENPFNEKESKLLTVTVFTPADRKKTDVK